MENWLNHKCEKIDFNIGFDYWNVKKGDWNSKILSKMSGLRVEKENPAKQNLKKEKL